MTQSARRLNENGLNAFGEFIEATRTGSEPELPTHLLVDDRYSAPLGNEVTVSDQTFRSRYELGLHLTNALADTNIQPLLGDQGFWTWLAMFWFDQLCAKTPAGKWKPAQRYNYILSPDYNHQPRHAVRTTWMLVNQFGESSLFLLGGAPDKRGDLVEQLAARQYLISCNGVVHAASRLYLDPERKTFKRGAAARSRKGNIRRFISYLQQLDLTYDLYSLSDDRIIEMLPTEYSDFIG